MFSPHDRPLRLTVGLSRELMQENDPFKEFISALLSPEIKLVAEAVRHFVEVASPAFLGPLLRISAIHGDPLPSKICLKYGPGLESVVTTTTVGDSKDEEVVVGTVYVGLNDRHGRHLRPMDNILHLVAMDEKVLIQGYRTGWPSQSNHIVQRIERIDSRNSNNMFTPQQATSFRTPLTGVEKEAHYGGNVDELANSEKSSTKKYEEVLRNRSNTTVKVRKSPRLNCLEGKIKTANNEESSPPKDYQSTSNCANSLMNHNEVLEKLSPAISAPKSFDLIQPAEVPSKQKEGVKSRSKRTQASRLIQEAASSGLLPKNGKRLSTPGKKRRADIVKEDAPISNKSHSENPLLKRTRKDHDERDFVEYNDEIMNAVSYRKKNSVPAAIFDDVLVSSSVSWASKKTSSSPSPAKVSAGIYTPLPDSLPSSLLNTSLSGFGPCGEVTTDDEKGSKTSALADDTVTGFGPCGEVTTDDEKGSKTSAFKSTDNATKNDTIIAGIEVPLGSRSPSPTFLWLQESCRARGLLHSGGREDLVKRLARFDDAENVKQAADTAFKVSASSNLENETEQKIVVSDRTRPSKKELQEMCLANGLSTAGNKADLRARLLASIEADEDSEDDTDYTLSAAITMGLSDSKAVLGNPCEKPFGGAENEDKAKEIPLPRRRSMNQKAVKSSNSSIKKSKSSSAGGLLGGLLGGGL